MRGEVIRVVAGRAGHGQNTPGRRFQGHDGTGFALQRLVSEVLQLGVNTRFDSRALVGLAGEGRLQLLQPQRIRFTRQHRVFRAFNTLACARDDGEVAGDWRIQFRLRVLTLVLESILRRYRLRQNCTVRGSDGSARDGELVVESSRIACVGVELVGAENHEAGG